MRVIVWLTALWLGVSATADAQPRRGGGDPFERRGSASGAGTSERREQLKRKIRAMRAYTLTEELALDEATAGRLFPMLARYDDETDKLLERRVELQRRLRRARAIRDPKAIDRLIDDAIANQRGFWDLEDRRVGELRKILTPSQVATMLVVLPAIERRIQNQLRRAIVRSQPDDTMDDDDDPEADALPPASKRQRRREDPLAPGGQRSNAPGNTPPM